MEEVKNYPPYLDYPNPNKEQTNADRIRAMSDRELASFLASHDVKQSIQRLHDKGCEPTATQIKVIMEKLCYLYLGWLRTPADGGDGNEMPVQIHL